MIGLDRLKLKLFKKEWNPDCKDTEFCCINCGRVHRQVICFNSNKGMIKLKGKKTAKKTYTLDFCSAKCMNEYAQQASVQLFAFSKMGNHLKTGFWKKRWLGYWKWKQKRERGIK